MKKKELLGIQDAIGDLLGNLGVKRNYKHNEMVESRLAIIISLLCEIALRLEKK